MEAILKSYDTDPVSAESLTNRVTRMVHKYKKSGVTRENLTSLVCGLVMDVKNIKKLTGPEKKDLVLDLTYMIIEQVDEGDEDTEFEKIIKIMVPPMIDSLALMIKVNKGCSCF
jgi:hypothetical protein